MMSLLALLWICSLSICCMNNIHAWMYSSIAQQEIKPSTRLFNAPIELVNRLDPNRKWTVKLIYKGQEKEVTIRETTSILEAAEKIWKDVPNSCRNGICTTCAGQIKAGEESIQLAIHGLGKPQLDAKFILACQTFIIGSGAVIELDKYDECYESLYGQFETSYKAFKYLDEEKRDKPKKGFFNF